MRYLIKADKTHRKIFSQNEWKINVKQAVARTVQFPMKYRVPVAVSMNTPAHIEHSFVRIRNRCVVSNRGNAVYRGLGLCRICFRNWAHQGMIPGIRKSSW